MPWLLLSWLNGNMSCNHFSASWPFNLLHNQKGEKNNHYAPTHTNTHFQESISSINKNKHTHTPKHTHPFTEYPFSKRLPAVNNKHADCLDAIKRPLRAFSFQLADWNGPALFKSVGVARCIVCYRRVLFKESKSLNIRTKVPQGLRLPSLALIPNRGLGEGGNVWAKLQAKFDA